LDLGNILVVTLLVYYTSYFVNLLFFGRGKVLQLANVRLDSLRSRKVLTLREQKEFLNVKYPKIVKVKKSFGDWLFIVLWIILVIIVFACYNWLFSYWNVHLSLFWGIVICSVSPLVINLFLWRWNLQNNDLVDIIKNK